MNVFYVLIVLSYVYGGRVTTHVEFNSKEACEDAKKWVEKESITSKAECFKKHK